MNHIARLMKERDEALAQVKAIREELIAVESYYLSSKFHAHDYAYVRTDVLPRLTTLKFLSI